MSLSPSPGTRASCSSCLGALERTSVRPAAGTSVPRWTSCFAETPAPASPSCCSTSTTWCPAASTRQERAPAPWVWPPMWWRTQRPGSWCCRPAHWSWATTASAASTSSTRWATTHAPCCTRSWSSRPSPLQRYMSPHLIRNRLEVRKRKELSVSLRLCFSSCPQAGIICQLNARTAVLAAANPVESQWNPKKTTIENIQLPHTLLSRWTSLHWNSRCAHLCFDHAKAAASGSEVTDPHVAALQTKLNFVFVAPSDSTSFSWCWIPRMRLTTAGWLTTWCLSTTRPRSRWRKSSWTWPCWRTTSRTRERTSAQDWAKKPARPSLRYVETLSGLIEPF